MKTENTQLMGNRQGGEGERQGGISKDWCELSPWFFRFERRRDYEPSRAAWDYATDTSADELAHIIKGA